MSRLALKKPIVWIDLETTGLDTRRDRIIEVSVMREEPGGGSETKTRRVNPEMPISPESIKVHGITDADVAGEPTFGQLAKGLHDFLEGADLGGFGIARFDIPVLVAEFRRAGITFSLEGRAVIDAKQIFHRFEPRDLSAAIQFYCDRNLDDAHSAEADVIAARDVFYAQLERYPEIPADVGEISDSFRDTNWIDAEGKLAWRGGEASVNFGKHRGRSLRELAEREPDYLRWMLDRDFPPDVTAIIRDALEGSFPKVTK